MQNQEQTGVDDCSVEQTEDEITQDEKMRREEEKKKARLRRRGPYRKAHADR